MHVPLLHSYGLRTKAYFLMLKVHSPPVRSFFVVKMLAAARISDKIQGTESFGTTRQDDFNFLAL